MLSTTKLVHKAVMLRGTHRKFLMLLLLLKIKELLLRRLQFHHQFRFQWIQTWIW